MSLAESTIKSSTILFIGQAISAVILGITSIVLARLLLPTLFGLYSLILLPFYFAQPIRDWGIPTLMQQKIAETETQTQSQYLRGMAFSGVVMLLFAGLVVSTALWVSVQIISTFIGPDFPRLIPLILPLVSFVGIYRAGYRLFVGMDKPIVASSLFIGGAAIKMVLSIGLVAFGYGVEGALAGFSIAYTIAAIVAIILLIKSKHEIEKDDSKSKMESISKLRFIVKLTNLAKNGTPIAVAEISEMLADLLILLIGAVFLSYADYGVYSASRVLFIQIGALFTPFVHSMLTTFSRMSTRNPSNLQFSLSLSTFVSSILIIPMSAFFVVTAEPIILVLFGVEYINAGLLLALLCSTFVILSPFGFFSLPSLTLGYALFKEYGIANLASVCGSTLITLFLIQPMGYYAIPVAVFSAALIRTILWQYFINSRLSVSLESYRSIKLLISNAVALGGAVVARWCFSFLGHMISSLVGALFFMIIFSVLLVLSNPLSKQESALIIRVLEAHPLIRRFAPFIEILTNKNENLKKAT